MKGLTRRQKDVLDFIEMAIRSKGYPPSIREIAAHLELASAAGVHKHVKALVRKGYLSKENHLSRSLRPLAAAVGPSTAPADTVELPLVGYVAAGKPIEAIAQQEVLPVPATLLSTRRRHFVLRVRGDSMIEESILDGDYVIMEEREEARNGEVVVALINNQEATLKRFYRENGRVRLQPANAAMEPIIVRDRELRIQGVVVAVWRQY
jgi:repressor LexA